MYSLENGWCGHTFCKLIQLKQRWCSFNFIVYSFLTSTHQILIGVTQFLQLQLPVLVNILDSLVNIWVGSERKK